jgi:hypothetical protein
MLAGCELYTWMVLEQSLPGLRIEIAVLCGLCVSHNQETRTGAVEQDLKSLQGSVADVGDRTGVCEKSLNGLSSLQEAFLKARNKLDTVEKQVSSIKIKDLPKIVNEQKKLRDRLNGVSGEVQGLTGAEPKNKRQRRRPRREEDSPSDSDDEDAAEPGPGSQGTPSQASSKPAPETPASDSSPDSINDKSSKSPPTCLDSTSSGPKEQSDSANDNSSDSPPISSESSGTGPNQYPQPPASSPEFPPEDTPKEDPETGDNQSGKEVPDNRGSSEPRTPPPSSPKEPLAPVTEPKAAQNLTGDKYYEALGVELDATPGQIRKACKVRASSVHPDKNKNDPGACHEAFVFLGEAYRILFDLKEKEAYDRARINGTLSQPAPASDGFVPDTSPLPSATPPVDLEVLRKVLEARISDRI